MMLSSKVQEIKQSAGEVADDIADKTKTVAAEVTADSKEVLENACNRVSEESSAIKTELDKLLCKVSDLLKPEASRELRQQLRQSLDGFTHRASAWAEGREEELAAALSGTRLRTRRMIYERPLSSLFIAAGTGALVAYWLSHRSTDGRDF